MLAFCDGPASHHQPLRHVPTSDMWHTHMLGNPMAVCILFRGVFLHRSTALRRPLDDDSKDIKLRKALGVEMLIGLSIMRSTRDYDCDRRRNSSSVPEN
jgi:hypothetical protein